MTFFLPSATRSAPDLVYLPRGTKGGQVGRGQGQYGEESTKGGQVGRGYGRYGGESTKGGQVGRGHGQYGGECVLLVVLGLRKEELRRRLLEVLLPAVLF